MTSSTVISDWRIACEMDASPEEIKAYVAIKHALRLAVPDAGTVAAVGELGRMEPWAQITALPELCSIILRGDAREIAAIDDNVFGPMARRSEPVVREPLRAALDEFCSLAGPKNVIYLLKLVIKALPESTSKVPDRSLMSVDRHEAAIAVLAVLNAIAIENTASARAHLDDSDEQIGDPVLKLIDSGLRGEIGRWGLLLAVDLCLSLHGLRPRSVLRRALDELSDEPALDPDLVQRFVRLAFLQRSRGHAHAPASLYIAELGNFNLWRETFGKRFDDPAGAGGQRRGFDETQRLRRSLAATFWQDSVLRLMRDRIGTTAPDLFRLFRPRVVNLGATERREIRGGRTVDRTVARLRPISEPKERAASAKLVLELLQDGGEVVDTVLFKNDGQDCSFALAPWYMPRARFVQRRLNVPNPVHLLRMVSWAAIACELLLSVAEKDKDSLLPRYAGLFLLHTVYWLDAHKRNDKAPVLPPFFSELEVAALREIADSLVQKTAGGRYLHPSPEFFVALIDRASKRRFMQDDEFADREDSTRWRRELVRQIEATLLLTQQAVAVTEDEDRISRWLDRSSFFTRQLLSLLQDDGQKPADHAVFSARCLERFIEQSRGEIEWQTENPLTKVADSGTWSSIKNNRSFLVAGTVNYEEWTVGETEIEFPDDQFASALCITLQRVAAAQADKNVPPALAERWLENFRSILSRASDRSNFDRFVPLRMVELLQAGAFDANSELVDLIFRRIVAFGSNLGLKRLAQWIVELPASSAQEANRKKVFFGALSRYLYLLTNSRYNLDRPQDPDDRARSTARARILRRMLCACLVGGGKDNLELSPELAMAASAERDATIDSYAWDLGESFPIEIDQEGRPRPLEGRRQAEIHTAKLLAYDAPRSAMRRLGWVDRHAGWVNLFAGGVGRGRSGIYVGVVANGGGADPTIFLSPDRPLTIPLSKCSELQKGSVVAVSLTVAEGGGLASDRVSQVRPLPDRDNLASRTWSIELLQFGGGVVAYARAPDRRERLNWTRHSPNFLAMFARNGEQPYPVRVLRSNDRSAAASLMMAAFSDLLLDEARILAEGGRLPLCILSFERDAHDRLAFVTVETRPFVQYRFDTRFDLTEAGRKQLEDILLKAMQCFGSRIDGLIVTFATVIADDGPKLAVVSDAEGVTAPWCSQRIETPADHRNLHWREYFSPAVADEDGDPSSVLELLATRKRAGDEFAARVSILEGFPGDLTLKLGSPVRRDQLSIPVQIDRYRHNGDPYFLTFEADVIEAFALDVSRHPNPTEYIDWLLGKVTTSFISIARFAGFGPATGVVYGYTKENLQVHVYAESLSLLPFGPAQPAGRWNARLARVLSAKQELSFVEPDFDIAEVPETAYNNDVAHGIIISIPKPEEEGSSLCTIVWRTLTGLIERPLHLRNLSAFRKKRLQPGSRVVVERGSGRNDRRIDVISVFAEALWQESKDDQPGEFVGRQVLSDETLEVYQTEPGRLRMARTEGSAESVHNQYVRTHLDNCQLTKERTFNSPRTPRPRERGELTWRVVLKVRGDRDSADRFITGLGTKITDSDGPCHLSGMDLDIVPERISGQVYLLVRRKLRVRLEAARAVPENRQFTDHGLAAERVARHPADGTDLLRKWYDSGLFVDGTHDRQHGCFIPHDRYAQRLLPDGVLVADNSLSRVFPNNAESAYANVSARLVVTTPGAMQGSYTDTPPYSISDLRACIDNEEDDGRTVKIQDDIQLFYAGRDGDSETAALLFEWGYGFWAALPPSQVRFRSKPIETADFALFFADRVTGLRWLRDERDQLVLSIERTTYSAAHILYDQANDHNVVHLLYVSVARDGAVQIERIEGFNARDQENIVREFFGVPAVLDRDSAAEVARLAAERRGSHDAGELAILGRVQTSAYRRAGGRTLTFRAVRSGHLERNHFEPLRPGDRLFVEAQEIFAPHENDLALRVAPLSILPQETIDRRVYEILDDGTRRSVLRINRRAFSYDEGALARISNFYASSQNPEVLKGRLLMVRVSRIDANRIELAYLDGAPPRHPRILDGLLSQTQDRLLAVLVAYERRRSGTRYVRLEARPGVLIDLDDSLIKVPGNASRGDVLRIERASIGDGVRYRAIFAIYSDRRYARSKRPAVALPAAELIGSRPPFKDDNELREASGRFTVGDFRQLWASLAWNSDATAADQTAILIEFMSRPHPKLSWLEPSRTGRYIISPATADEVLAGCIEVVDSSTPNDRAPGVQVRLLTENQLSRTVASDWHHLTYRFGSAREVARRVRQVKWSYHDRTSVVWKRHADWCDAEVIVLPSHTAATGPLFFSLQGEVAVLRYPVGELPKRVLGFSNLRHILSEKSRHEFVVAGVSPEGGIYVEALPGRIFEVPWAITSYDEQDCPPLDKLAWQVFGTGDIVTLRRSSSRADRYAQEGALLTWRHGVCNAFGAKGALMRRVAVDHVNGAGLYQSGNFEIRIPTAQPESCPSIAYVAGSRLIRSAHLDEGPEVGSTIFLTHDNGLVSPAEFGGWAIVPHRDAGLRSDQFLGEAMHIDAKGRTMVDWRLLGALVDAVGGALPVTVEVVRPPSGGERGLLFFSRRNQVPAIAIEQVVRAVVVGYLAAARRVILAIGGHHLAIPIGRFVQGLPNSLWQTAVDGLASIRAEVWVQRFEDGYDIGIGETNESRFKVRSLYVVSRTAGEQWPEPIAEGIVCTGTVDRKLYWLSANQAAATRLTQTQALQAFPPKGEAFDVTRLKTGAISILDLPRVKGELDSLRLRKPLVVQIVPGTSADVRMIVPSLFVSFSLRCALVRSVGTGLLLAIAVRSDSEEMTTHKAMSVEIAWRWIEDEAVKLLAVEKGYLPVRHDLYLTGHSTQFPDVPDHDERFIIGFGETYGSITARDLFTSPSELSQTALIDLPRELRKQRTFGLRVAFQTSRLLAALCRDKGQYEESAERSLWELHAEMGSRLMRSFHLEPIGRRQAAMRRGDILQQETDTIKEPIDRLLTLLYESKGFGASNEVQSKLYSLMLFASLVPQTEYAQHLTHALAAGIGSDYDLALLHSKSKIVAPIVDVLRPYMLSRIMMTARTISEIHKRSLEVLKQKCLELEEEDFDIALFSPFSVNK